MKIKIKSIEPYLDKIPIKYDELKTGEPYKSYFKGQGWFYARKRTSGVLSLREDRSSFFTNYNNIDPGSGFELFYRLNDEELAHLYRCIMARDYVD